MPYATQEATDLDPHETAPLVAFVARDARAGQLVAWTRQGGHTATLFPLVTRLLDHPQTPAVVCLDLDPEEASSLAALQLMRAEHPDVPVIVLGARRDAEAAVTAMRAGAHDYLPQPVDRKRLLCSLGSALDQARLTRSRAGARHERWPHCTALLGDSGASRRVTAMVERVLDSDVSVCLTGEAGTGKESIARTIHDEDHRPGAFIVAQCSALPAAEQQEALVGRDRTTLGAPAAANRSLFERARGGTLCLQDVASLTLEAQAALLRTLQSEASRRDGSRQLPGASVRCITTTTRDLRAAVDTGLFREDLFFQLVVYPIELCPLRERKSDLPLIIGQLIDELGRSMGRRISGVDPDALKRLMNHPWPGNLRELRGTLQRAILASNSNTVRLAALPEELRPAGLGERRSSLPAIEHEHDEIVPLRELERRAILRALKAANGNVAKAAKLLGIGRATLYRRLGPLERSRGAA